LWLAKGAIAPLVFSDREAVGWVKRSGTQR